MRVLTWDKKRRTLLKTLAAVDEGAAQRADSVRQAWATMSDENRALSPALQEEIDGILAPEEFATPEEVLLQPRQPEPVEPIPPNQEHITESENNEVADVPPKRKSLAHYLD